MFFSFLGLLPFPGHRPGLSSSQEISFDGQSATHPREGAMVAIDEHPFAAAPDNDRGIPDVDVANVPKANAQVRVKEGFGRPCGWNLDRIPMNGVDDRVGLGDVEDDILPTELLSIHPGSGKEIAPRAPSGHSDERLLGLYVRHNSVCGLRRILGAVADNLRSLVLDFRGDRFHLVDEMNSVLFELADEPVELRGKLLNFC